MPWSVPYSQQIANEIVAFKRILALPCSQPTAVYAELTAEALLKAAMSILEPDLKEIIHKLTGSSVVKHIEGGLLDATEGAPTAVKKATRGLIHFARAADIANWWLFLATVVGEGLIGASSQLKNMQGCKDPDDPRYGTGAGYVSAIPDNGEWRAIDYSFSSGNIYYPVHPSSATAYPGTTALCACSAQFEAFGGTPVGTASRVTRSDTGARLDYDNNNDDIGSSDRATHVWFKGTNTGADIVRLEANFQYTGIPLPLQEAFPIEGTEFAYLYGDP